ncbi:MAG: signal peptidase I [Flavobacteriaceae bacterium]|nr:signal peptidase I [Flavobacteriaceae bacterium]
MTLTQWFIFFLLIQVIHGLSTWKLYSKAGRQAWEAFVPVYNAIVLMQIINRPKWWTILLFVPIINLIMFPVLWVETCRSFGKNTYLDTALAVLSCGLYVAYLNYTQDLTHIKDRSIEPKSSSGEWTSSILFAIVAATLVHTYFMQPFVIPTSSLEKSLLKGDFLLVSKFHYGARLPMTAIAAPMVHDTLPKFNVPSYLKKPQIPYLRIPGFQKIKRNDIVVFNWPADTLFNMYKKADKKYEKPIDKKTNYVKRCVGIAGDSLEIRDGYVFIDGKQTILPDRAKTQFYYTVISKKYLTQKYLKEEIGTTEFNSFYKITKAAAHTQRYNNIRNLFKPFPNDSTSYLIELSGGMKVNNDFRATDRYSINMSDEEQEKLSKNTSVVSITRNIKPKGEKEGNIFPKYSNYNWNGDNYGPIYIPEAGKTVELNKEVLPLYKAIITEYEGNKLNTDGNDIYINGKIATTYTFKQDYYWMMGDNRQNSLDARYWGYVPFDHVVGKPVFVWMSISGVELGFGNFKNWVFNTERIFTTVGGSGKPVSYLPYFLVVIALWQGFKFYRKKKKANEE